METGPRTCVLLTTGCYVVLVRIGAGVVEFLVDSGSAATVLRAVTFETAERDTRAVLRESKLNLCTASGQNLDIRGETTLELGIGDQIFPHSVVVGDIGNSAGILGTDFIQKHGRNTVYMVLRR